MKIAYQGAPGAYSEAAVEALFPGDEPLPQRAFVDAFASLTEGAADAAVLPVENTHAGSVVDVYDLLREHADVRVIGEAVVRVRHSLLAPRGTRLEDVRIARSHPQALAQVDGFLRAHRIAPEVAHDTAGAAADLARAGGSGVAAVASKRAAKRYGLEVLASGIETSADNFTRFFALARASDLRHAERIPAGLRDGPLKTSLAYASANVPGALVRSLQPFATAALQLTKIESRPSRAAPWDYVFYLDVEADPDTSPAREALALMRTCCAWVQVLGTYRAATRVLDPDA